MIIRSQDKTKIFNFEQIRRIDCGNGMIVVDNTALIGEYSTEEKAMKVLDMICDFYIRMVDVTNNIVQAKKEDSYVFQMPSDEEVEV